MTGKSMKVTEILKNKNRTLLEVDTGVLFWALAAMAAGFALPLERWGIRRGDWCAGIWTAAFLVMLSVLHMYRSLDRALDFDAGTANKLAVRGYLIRYAVFAVILAVVAVTEIMNPVILCLSYLLLMKVAVYSQPFTHKLYNKLFHEIDPEPEALVEEAPEAGQS